VLLIAIVVFVTFGALVAQGRFDDDSGGDGGALPPSAPPV
jgi:hypothetical protein